jgi:hypothetical protein
MNQLRSIRDAFPQIRATPLRGHARGRPRPARRAVAAIALLAAMLGCAACGEVQLTFTPPGDAGPPDASGDGAASCTSAGGDAECVPADADAGCDGACESFDGGWDEGGFDAGDDGASSGDASDDGAWDGDTDGASDASFFEGG